MEWQRRVSTATIIWTDPGLTTGVCLLSIDSEWLCGQGSPDWAGLRNVIRHRWFAQLGNHAKVVEGGEAVPYEPERLHDDAEQRQRGYGPAGGLPAVFKGKGRYRGGPASPLTTRLLRQAVQMRGILEAHPEAAWGHEDFILRTRDAKRETLSPVALNAMMTTLELICGARARWPFVQGASLAMSTATNERLKDAGLYTPGLPHAVDATRHAATFLRRCRADPALRSAAWPALFDMRFRAK